MKKSVIALVLIAALGSCIPYQIAPSITDYKLVTGKRFKKSLPKTSVFVFRDPKAAGHFYDYINIKFGLQDDFVGMDVPFVVEGQSYLLTYYEVEKSTKKANLIPIAADLALMQAANFDDTSFDEFHSSRKGFWYIAIEVFSSTGKDALNKGSVSRPVILKYLRALKEEYLATHNYNEVIFKN